MIQQYPDSAQVPGTRRPAPPPSVLSAARVMYAGAVASVILAITYVMTMSATKTAIEKKNPHFSASTLSTVTHVGVIIGTIGALIGAVLFIWIARSCKSGKNWARVTATVLAAVSVLGTLYDFVSAVAPAVRVFNLVLLLTGLAAVTLLWLGSSNAYFSFFKRPQF